MPILGRKTTKRATTSPVTKERRRASRKNVKLLTAFRVLDKDSSTKIKDGFARALSLSDVGALLETPDLFKVGQKMEMEFLLDENRIATVRGKIVRIDKRKDFYENGIEFEKVSAKVKKWIEAQMD